MRQMEISREALITPALILGSLLLLGSLGFLVNGIRRIRGGASFFGKGGSSTYVLLGFALFAMGSLVFLIGVLRASM